MKGQDPIAPALSLSAFLRALRERQSPAEFGLAAGPRRRTPGLRREEVAQLCGLSVTWYTWIEQGRDVSVSATTLARLARGLRLSRAERSCFTWRRIFRKRTTLQQRSPSGWRR